MVVADLHVHTTNSDGALTLETLPAAADRAGVEVVAVTDHDRLHPDIEGAVVEVGGVTVVHGIELRVDAGDQRLDLLGYGLERTDDLTALTERLQTNRIERARRIVDAVESETGAELSVAFEPGVGRPHIARAIEESDAPYDYRGAFAALIGDDGPCFVPRDIPDFEAGRAVLAEACAVVGLAHPFRYSDPAAALDRAAVLDAVEIPYPYEHEVDREPARRVAEEHDLLVTGGSDAHDEELGLAGLSREAYRRFESAL
jgi:predicted metal-dependent phosphoesterase TrpH